MAAVTFGLLWEIWRRHRGTLAAIAGFTVAGRLADFYDTSDSSPVTILLAMMAFLLLLGVFNYTEASGTQALGGFPRRVFTLPVTSLRLVTVPVVAGILSIELLYLLWLPPLSRGGTSSIWFVALLLAALMVFYLWALWTLERVGPLRLFVLGAIGVGLFLVNLWPSFPPTPPPLWRSEIVMAGLVAGLAVVAFVLAWRHVDRLRYGGAARRALGAESFLTWIALATPARRTPFASPEAAHFWFEWRASGLLLPALVAGVLIVQILPASFYFRDDASNTFRLLMLALAAPILLAIPAGIAVSKPVFWSDDLAVPALVAVRPLSSGDLVAIKVKVAAVSAALSWLVLLVVVTVWLSLWGNLDAVSRFALQLWVLHGHSVAAVYGIAALVAAAGLVLTWRCLVSRLWSGLSGKRSRFLGSVGSVFLLAIAILMSAAAELPEWLLDDPARLAPIAWMLAAAVIVKYWLAAYSWRDVAPQHLRSYLLVWLAGTALCLAVGLVVWGMARLYVPIDADRLRGVVILLALLAVPLARVGLAQASIAQNRHRS
jgi:hypothetical protein